MDIDVEVLREIKDAMKKSRIAPEVRVLAPDLEPFTEDIRGIDPASYKACISPMIQSTSVMPEPIYSKECFKEFMDELIAYIEDPTPTRATWVRALQHRYNISVFMTEYPERLSYRVSISLTLPGDRWKIDSWDEMVSDEVSEIISKAVDFL